MIYKLNGLNFDIHAEHRIADVNYPRGWFMDAANRAAVGLTEHPDPIPAPPTLDQIKARLSLVVQMHLDSVAASRGYDSIISACSYAGAANPFQAEGAAFLTWRGAVWTTCHTLLAGVVAGTRPVPTEAELIALLPVFV